MGAKELKKRNWQFSKKHLIWFKSHDKSKEAQEYLVFDKNKWTVKKTNSFEHDPQLVVHDI